MNNISNKHNIKNIFRDINNIICNQSNTTQNSGNIHENNVINTFLKNKYIEEMDKDTFNKNIIKKNNIKIKEDNVYNKYIKDYTQLIERYNNLYEDLKAVLYKKTELNKFPSSFYNGKELFNRNLNFYLLLNLLYT